MQCVESNKAFMSTISLKANTKFPGDGNGPQQPLDWGIPISSGMTASLPDSGHVKFANSQGGLLWPFRSWIPTGLQSLVQTPYPGFISFSAWKFHWKFSYFNYRVIYQRHTGALDPDNSGFEFQLLNFFLEMWPWTSHLSFQWLGFLILKMGIISTQRIVVEIRYNECKVGTWEMLEKWHQSYLHGPKEQSWSFYHHLAALQHLARETCVSRSFFFQSGMLTY